MYTHYLIHLCLLKFDVSSSRFPEGAGPKCLDRMQFFFFVGFSMQYLILVLSVQEAEVSHDQPQPCQLLS
jgi:hypothetical protein